MRFSSVVLPEPRKPVIIVNGTGFGKFIGENAPHLLKNRKQIRGSAVSAIRYPLERRFTRQLSYSIEIPLKLPGEIAVRLSRIRYNRPCPPNNHHQHPDNSLWMFLRLPASASATRFAAPSD